MRKSKLPRTNLKQIKPEEIKPGMQIRVYQKITDITPKGEKKSRLQIFEGVVLARHRGKSRGATFTVRKIANGIGVEKIFPLHSPLLEKIELVKEYKVRRAKLYYLRNYKKKLREKIVHLV